MARTRYVKIGFFRNEALAEFGPWHRLLFEGLWLLADRSGRLEDRAKRIKADLFPYDALDVEPMLADLAAGVDPFIRRYEAEGRRYIAVLNFNAHQRPHHKEPESKIPEPPETLEKTQRPDRLGARTAPETSPPASNGEWGMGNGELVMGKGQESADAAPAPPDAADLAGLWNTLTTAPIAHCRELSNTRIRAARKRLAERALDEWREVIARIERSAFCHGENDRGWVASFDWLLQTDTAAKVLEGKYDNRAGSRPNAKPMMDAKEIRDHARMNPGGWASECVNLHDGKCGGPNTHRDRMMQAVEDFVDGGKRAVPA